MSTPAGFIVSKDVMSHPAVGENVRRAQVQLQITWPKDSPPSHFEQEDIQRAIVALLPQAYMELEARAG